MDDLQAGLHEEVGEMGGRLRITCERGHARSAGESEGKRFSAHKERIQK